MFLVTCIPLLIRDIGQEINIAECKKEDIIMKSNLTYLWMMLISVIFAVSLTACGGGGGGSSSSSGVAEAAPITTTADTFIKGVAITRRSASDTDGVVSIACATNESVVGGGCFCSGSALVNQDGVLFSCEPGTTYFIGACYTQSVGQTVTPITVYALCMSTTSASAVTSAASLANVDNTSMSTELPKSAELLEMEDKFSQMIEEHNKNLMK